MARLTNEELENIKRKYNVDTLWSWSRVDKARTFMYEYYLKYVKRIKEDNNDSAYAPLGGISHNILEDLYENRIKYEEMPEKFDDGWEVAVDFAKLKFNRTDKERNEKIKLKYKNNLQLFFMNHKTIPYKVLCEKFLLTKIDKYIFQGYADAIFVDDEKKVNIVDFKTSTIYTSKALEEHSGQLTIYAMSLIQNGVPIDKIKICFNFLKYVTVECTQANGKKKERNIERYELGQKLNKNIAMWLRKEGYSDIEIDEYLKKIIDGNDISVLPVEIQSKYKISDCYVYVDLTKELIDKWETEIVNTIKDIELRVADYNKSIKNGIESDKMFWDSDENIIAQEYYLSNLCGYSINMLKPYKAYLDKKELEKQGLSTFTGVGEADNNYIVSESNTNENVDDDEIDLSWLDELK